MPSEHAGAKWRLTYVASAGGSGNLELDVNFMLRPSLWAPKIAQCFAVGSFKAAPVPVLDPHELAAGKLAALLARSANRDIFDAHRLLGASDLDRERLRLAFVVYGGINRKDWRRAPQRPPPVARSARSPCDAALRGAREHGFGGGRPPQADGWGQP
jgi:hypothetical protein